MHSIWNKHRVNNDKHVTGAKKSEMLGEPKSEMLGEPKSEMLGETKFEMLGEAKESLPENETVSFHFSCIDKELKLSSIFTGSFETGIEYSWENEQVQIIGKAGFNTRYPMQPHPLGALFNLEPRGRGKFYGGITVTAYTPKSGEGDPDPRSLSHVSLKVSGGSQVENSGMGRIFSSKVSSVGIETVTKDNCRIEYGVYRYRMFADYNEPGCSTNGYIRGQMPLRVVFPWIGNQSSSSSIFHSSSRMYPDMFGYSIVNKKQLVSNIYVGLTQIQPDVRAIKSRVGIAFMYGTNEANITVDMGLFTPDALGIANVPIKSFCKVHFTMGTPSLEAVSSFLPKVRSHGTSSSVPTLSFKGEMSNDSIGVPEVEQALMFTTCSPLHEPVEKTGINSRWKTEDGTFTLELGKFSYTNRRPPGRLRAMKYFHTNATFFNPFIERSSKPADRSLQSIPLTFKLESTSSMKVGIGVPPLQAVEPAKSPLLSSSLLPWGLILGAGAFFAFLWRQNKNKG